MILSLFCFVCFWHQNTHPFLYLCTLFVYFDSSRVLFFDYRYIYKYSHLCKFAVEMLQ